MDFNTMCQQFVESGKCHTECCGVMVFDADWYIKHRDQALKPHEAKYDGKQYIFVFTDDFSCIFLNTQKKCVIYDERPEICRQYGVSEHREIQCPYLCPDGSIRTRADRRRLLKEVGNTISNAKRQLELQQQLGQKNFKRGKVLSTTP